MIKYYDFFYQLLRDYRQNSKSNLTENIRKVAFYFMHQHSFERFYGACLNCRKFADVLCFLKEKNKWI